MTEFGGMTPKFEVDWLLATMGTSREPRGTPTKKMSELGGQYRFLIFQTYRALCCRLKKFGGAVRRRRRWMEGVNDQERALAGQLSGKIGRYPVVGQCQEPTCCPLM